MMTLNDVASLDVGRWMLAATALGALLSLGAGSVERLRRMGGDSARGPWALALGAAVVWPIAAAFWLTQPIDEVPLSAGPPHPGSVIMTPAHSAPGVSDSVAAWWSQHGSKTLLLIWFATSVLLVARLVLALRHMQRAAHSAHATELHGHRVFLTESLGPAAFGVWRPRIMIPRWVLDLDEALQALVVRHEYEHAVRRDTVLVLLAVVCTTFVPWNASVWYLARRLRIAVEVDCDARTIRACPEQRTAYARLLLFIAQHATVVRIVPALVYLPSHLSRRIAAMTTASPSRPALHRIGAVTVFGLSMLAACSHQLAGNLAGPTSRIGTSTPGAGAVAAGVESPKTAATGNVPASPSRVDVATQAALPYFDFQVDQPARMRAGSPAPQYPADLRVRKVEGTVLAQYVVGTDGRVDTATFKVLKSDNGAFAAAVRQSMVTMAYEPAMVKGKPVKQLVQQHFAFAINKSEPAGSPTQTPAATPDAPNPPPAAIKGNALDTAMIKAFKSSREVFSVLRDQLERSGQGWHTRPRI